MPQMNPNSCRILTYGKDETLLMTRKAILETARFTCDTAHTAEDFVGCINSSPRGYDIFIVCHSVPPEEQQVIVEAAKGSDVEVYVLKALIQPEDFVAHVQELSKQC
jgi:DNA-binding response OmpR family regulator